MIRRLQLTPTLSPAHYLIQYRPQPHPNTQYKIFLSLSPPLNTRSSPVCPRHSIQDRPQSVSATQYKIVPSLSHLLSIQDCPQSVPATQYQIVLSLSPPLNTRSSSVCPRQSIQDCPQSAPAIQYKIVRNLTATTILDPPQGD
ncbi:hypothetical protein ElyMa_001240300 [Elysia marginata]|uniref:Uncharacterized protein n=1 Tax=Elysia marginata TaxID=1093978 RepID=A0AAV4ICC3_9GAST|nr:hypothetical protein ElyMa_001240300 [Elysia marginata]